MGEGIEPGTFELLSPSRFVSFAFPNPFPDSNLYAGDHLRVAVLDSPLPSPPSPPLTAAMLVPAGREDDWVFSTASGHLHLLLSSSLSRLILVGSMSSSSSSSPKPYSRPSRGPDPDGLHRFRHRLLPLLLALSPKAAFGSNGGLPEIPFLSYDDDVVCSDPVEHLVGSAAGEMLVEDVGLDRSPAPPERRRRLRFKRMPNLVQTQARLIPDSSEVGIFRPESGSLVQPYLGPMVASLSLISPVLGERVQSGLRPSALCLGVGGGALLMSLRSEFGFDVVGVEADDVVLGVARRHFGLIEDVFLQVHVGDAIELVSSFAKEAAAGHCLGNGGHPEDSQKRLLKDPCYGFDAIMIDLDSQDVSNGVCAPPLDFIQKNVLLALRSALYEHGILVINVVPLNAPFCNGLIDSLHEVFAELYELDVGNGENYVLIATASLVGADASESRDPFIKKLKEVVGETLVDGIKKI